MASVKISASMVRALRERTGAGMMDCKRALQETGGDIDAAVDEMRKSGVTKAASKAGRIAAEGMIALKVDEKNGAAVLLEVNCETDFVARDENFQAFSAQLADALMQRAPDGPEALAALPLEEGGTLSVEQARQQLVARLGENVTIRRFERVRQNGAGCLGVYLHGVRIGVVVELSVAQPELAKDLAMHVAAANPLCVAEQDLPETLLEKEREIHLAQARASGKPEAIIEKMVAGRVEKFVRESALSGQPFVKDPDTTIAQLLAKHGAEVRRFVRYEVGEGIEKRADDFAEQVMQQAGLNK